MFSFVGLFSSQKDQKEGETKKEAERISSERKGSDPHRNPIHHQVHSDSLAKTTPKSSTLAVPSGGPHLAKASFSSGGRKLQPVMKAVNFFLNLAKYKAAELGFSPRDIVAVGVAFQNEGWNPGEFDAAQQQWNFKHPLKVALGDSLTYCGQLELARGEHLYRFVLATRDQKVHFLLDTQNSNGTVGASDGTLASRKAVQGF